MLKMEGGLYCSFYWHHFGLPVVKTRFKAYEEGLLAAEPVNSKMQIGIELLDEVMQGEWVDVCCVRNFHKNTILI